MKYNIPDRVLTDILFLAEKHGIQKMILFGSRARGTHSERSDIDITVTGGNISEFYWDINEKVWSLLSFDIVKLDKGITDELGKEIEKDGIVIYEKTDNFQRTLAGIMQCMLERKVAEIYRMLLY